MACIDHETCCSLRLLATSKIEVANHHFVNQLLKGGHRLPAKLAVGLCWISKKGLNLGWTKITLINPDYC